MKILNIILFMATETANKKYKYNDEFYGKKLSEIVDIVHKYYSKKMNWKENTLYPGTFGYDNMAMSIGYALSETKDLEIKKLASKIHDGWIINYVYWRDNQPWLTNDFYKKPYSPLGDQRRNECANLPYDKLNKEEQEKDDCIAECLINLFSQK